MDYVNIKMERPENCTECFLSNIDDDYDMYCYAMRRYIDVEYGSDKLCDLCPFKTNPEVFI